MSPQLLEAGIVIVAGGLAISYAMFGSQVLRIASGVGGVFGAMVGLILAIHAGL